MMKFTSVLFAFFFTTSVFAAPDGNGFRYIAETDCDLIITTFNPDFRPYMSADELIEEADSATAFYVVHKKECNNSGNKKNGKNPLLAQSDGYWSTMSTPPVPDGLGWVLVGDFRSKQTINCTVVITDGWIYQRQNPVTGDIETQVETETTTYQILGCTAKTFPGPD